MREEQLNSPDTMCSRCGAEATWRFVDPDQQFVEINCPECGRFELSTAEFEEAEFDIAETEERRE